MQSTGSAHTRNETNAQPIIVDTVDQEINQ